MTVVDDRFALFDADGGGALLLTGYRRTIEFDEDASHLKNVFEAFEEAVARNEWIAVAADYALGACFEPALESLDLGCPSLRGWVFGAARLLDAQAVGEFLNARLAAVSEHERIAGVAELVPALDASAHACKVAQIRRWIADGDCYQINLTFPLGFRFYGHPLALYARLRERQPVRYGAFISVPEETLLSFSPELFFERHGQRVVTRPMKGTARRETTPEADAAQRSALLLSEKERAENIMIVDLLRNDLGRLAEPGKVRVESLCDAEAYPTLWQMVSTISAELPGVPLFDLFRALFPCGSITGAPKIRAMQRIAELETTSRGLYTGTLGWLAPGGDCRFNVAIRTLELQPDGRGCLGIGGGIVIDSDPASEYAECLLKARFLTALDPGFELVETLRLENGEYPLLGLHLERLTASAQALGFACDANSVAEALAVQAATNVEGVFRVRLTLAHSGCFKVTVAPLPENKPFWTVVLADEVLNVDDYLLRHKTTARSRYDRALAQLAATPEIFDAIFFNTRGEVCEGARSTVFVERDGVLLTPPLACGLLPGVKRRQLLESGRAIEHVLKREDLLGASRLYVANALRGLVEVRLQV